MGTAIEAKEKQAVAPLMQAVIFMGASSVSMMVAEEQGEELRVLDVLSQPLALAEDIFRNGRISRETMDHCADSAGVQQPVARVPQQR